ncbi:glycosyltransferase family 4 protein [Schlesneria paludicola]|uniref:glycosyltransferase family 4 protein n=1 Tax=Schlesneria paludicola TaxID=360056 RepID=UPI000299E5FE|nr:glycosyltransferase family 4 protein [Schlesneria paludicola]
MHIGLVRRQCSLKKAGAERYCVNLFRGLQALGHRVTVIGESIDDELRAEVEFLPVAVNKLTSWTKNRSFAENCEKLIRSQSFDIVHGLSRVAGLDTYRLTDPMQTHWVKVWYRNPVSRWLQQLNPRHRAIFELERRLYRPTGVRRVIVQSKLDARLLTEYFGVDESRIRRIVNGVDTRTFHPGVRNDRAEVRAEIFRQLGSGTHASSMAVGRADDETPLLIFASMDFRRKGLDSLLLAMSRMKNREVCLLVLGAGDISGYQRRANAVGLAGRIHFAGRQSAIQRYYGAGDLFVLPTIYEPFPNVNLEAMACGTPVITTATAGGADIIESGCNGYVIPDAWAVDQLADQIDRHFSLSRPDRQVMSDHCWQTASKLRVEDNARQVAEVFEEVLREKNAA